MLAQSILPPKMFKLQQKRLPLILVLLAILALGACQVKSPTNYEDPKSSNLEVDILVHDYAYKALSGLELNKAALSCSEIPVTDSENHLKILDVKLPTSPKSWCGVLALNSDQETNANGAAKFYFQIEPNPQSIKLEAYESGPAPYQIPMFYVNVEGQERIVNLVVINNNKWSGEIFIK